MYSSQILSNGNETCQHLPIVTLKEDAPPKRNICQDEENRVKPASTGRQKETLTRGRRPLTPIQYLTSKDDISTLLRLLFRREPVFLPLPFVPPSNCAFAGDYKKETRPPWQERFMHQDWQALIEKDGWVPDHYQLANYIC